MLPRTRRASVDAILDSQKLDPEELLEDLGFAGANSSLLQRLPSRFLSSQHGDQRLYERFHSLHPEFRENEDDNNISGIADLYDRLPVHFQKLEPSKHCTSLHKMVASVPPPVQRLRRGITAYSILPNLLQPKPQQQPPTRGRRKSSLKISNLATIGEAEIASAWNLTPASSTRSLSSCDVTDDSSGDELSPIVLNCRVPKFTFAASFNQDEVLDNLVIDSQALTPRRRSKDSASGRRKSKDGTNSRRSSADNSSSKPENILSDQDNNRTTTNIWGENSASLPVQFSLSSTIDLSCSERVSVNMDDSGNDVVKHSSETKTTFFRHHNQLPNSASGVLVQSSAKTLVSKLRMRQTNLDTGNIYGTDIPDYDIANNLNHQFVNEPNLSNNGELSNADPYQRKTKTSIDIQSSPSSPFEDLPVAKPVDDPPKNAKRALSEYNDGTDLVKTCTGAIPIENREAKSEQSSPTDCTIINGIHMYQIAVNNLSTAATLSHSSHDLELSKPEKVTNCSDTQNNHIK